ncbi:hypothetical protein [Streptomyces sp. TRM64462]|uniref:hypothetical protein n=1 Tax=Streptomyces sp. TRM64462 TaxID=2741726 RepID=UPI002814DCD0|nr:hypothetical protein [Streptomyces sp. TRM64462]
MTEPIAPKATRARRRRTIALLAVTAVLLLPPLVMLGYAAQDALQNKSATDWQANHRTRQSLERSALLIAAAPSVGAFAGWLVGRSRGHHAGTSAATGALLGTLAVWAIAIAWTLVALSRWEPHF